MPKRNLILFGILFLVLFLNPIQPTIPTNFKIPSSTSGLNLPHSPTRMVWHSLLWYAMQFLSAVVNASANVSTVAQKFKGSFTSYPPLSNIPQVWATDIAEDATCNANNSSRASISCNLNHTANVLILIYAMINNTAQSGGMVTGITVAGIAATALAFMSGPSSESFYSYWLYLPYASNDSVVVTFGGTYSNNIEAMIAISFIGTTITTPYVNSEKGTGPTASQSGTSLSIPSGEVSRTILNAVFITSSASITQGGSQTQITQLSGVTGANIELDYEMTGNATTVTSSWVGSTYGGAIGFALLPPSQILTESSSPGANAIGTGTVSNSTTGTISLIGHNADVVCLIAISFLDTSSQTVVSVQQANGNNGSSYWGRDENYIFLAAANNATNVRTEVWFTNDSYGGSSGTITVTMSAPVNGAIVGACFANARGDQGFEGLVTNTGDGTTASSGNVVGNNTAGRRIFLFTGFAVAAAPSGSQGVDLVSKTGTGVAVGMNYLDSSSTTNMAATDTNSNWAAIGAALLPFPIVVNSYCSGTSASSTTTSCSLSHAANVLIVIFAGNSGSDLPTSVTIGGNSASQLNTWNNGKTNRLGTYTYYSISAANDSVVVNWTSHNTNESLIAVSFLGTRSTAPFINAVHGSNGTGTACGIDPNGGLAPYGEINGLEIAAYQTAALNSFYETISSANNTMHVTQVSGNSNAMAVGALQGWVNKTIKENWGTSSTFVCVIMRIIPPGKVALDGTTGGGATGGYSVYNTNNVASSPSVTCVLPSHDANVLVMVEVVLADNSGQRVSSVKIGSTSFTQLATVSNGTSVSTDIWYMYDTNSGSETITITPSANSAMSISCLAFINTATSAPFFDIVNGSSQYVTATGSTAPASLPIITGTANRTMFMAVGVAANAPIYTLQGADLAISNSSTSGLAQNTNDFAPAGGQAYTMTANFTSNNWAAVGTAILDASSSGPGTVTQPVACTMDQAYGATVTLTISGGSPSPSTVNCDGTSHNITVNALTTLTATEPSDSSNDRQRFSGALTALSTTTCSSGTCTAWSFTNYDEKLSTIAISIGTGTTDSGLTWSFTGYVDSNPAATICTISPSSGQTSASSTCWSNYNRPMIAPAEPSGEVSNARFRNVADGTSTAATPTSGGNTYTITYDRQVQDTYQASPMSGFANDWVSGLTIPVTGSYLGTAETLCTLTPTAGKANPVSCQHWVDSGTAVTLLSNASGAATGTQWVAQGTNSFTDSTGGQTFNVNYLYEIVNVTVTVTVTVTITGTGSSKSGATAVPTGAPKLLNRSPLRLMLLSKIR